MSIESSEISRDAALTHTQSLSVVSYSADLD